MQIIIDENWALGADTNSWQIQKAMWRKKDGVKVREYQAIKWFASLDKAIKELADIRLRTSDCSTLAEALKFNKDVLTGIVRALAPDIKVIVKDDLKKEKETSYK